MKLKRSTFIVLLLATASVAWAAQAVTFPSIHEESGTSLTLKATVLKKIFFVRAMTAGFYFPNGVTAQDVLNDVPKRVDAVFLMHITHKDFSGYVRGKIWDNVTYREFKLLEERLKRMADYLVEIKPGDQYTLTYIPGEGSRFEYNGKLMGTIDGEDFGRAIFSIWLGKHPMDKGLKRQILEKFKEQGGRKP